MPGPSTNIYILLLALYLSRLLTTDLWRGGTLAPGLRVNSLLRCSWWLGQIRDSEGSQNNILAIYIYTATLARLQDGSGEGEALTGSSDSGIPQDSSPLVHWGRRFCFQAFSFWEFIKSMDENQEILKWPFGN